MMWLKNVHKILILFMLGISRLAQSLRSRFYGWSAETPKVIKKFPSRVEEFHSRNALEGEVGGIAEKL